MSRKEFFYSLSIGTLISGLSWLVSTKNYIGGMCQGVTNPPTDFRVDHGYPLHFYIGDGKDTCGLTVYGQNPVTQILMRFVVNTVIYVVASFLIIKIISFVRNKV